MTRGSTKKRAIDTFYANLGFRIRQARTLRKWSQRDLGIELGVAPQTMQRYETGELRIPAGAVGQCARLLGVSVDHLYTGAPKDAPRLLSQDDRIALMLAGEIMALPDINLKRAVAQLVHAVHGYAAANEEQDAGPAEDHEDAA